MPRINKGKETEDRELSLKRVKLICDLGGITLKIWLVIAGMFGGLGLFLYSIQMMASGMQKVAGGRLRHILEVLTGKPVVGVLTGIAVTVLVQSSSTTTVMLVGFVNAGLMSLAQAVSAIMGANIGTTITAQIVSFRFELLILPCIGVGGLLNFWPP